MTLMEMLIAIALTALISALAFPAMDRLSDRLALDQAVTGLAADMKRARADAERWGQPVALRVSDDGTSYWWRGGSLVALPRQVRAAERGNPVFYPDGTAQGGQVLVWQGRTHAAVTVQSLSGRIATAARP